MEVTLLTPSAVAANERGRRQEIVMPASPLARRLVHPEGTAGSGCIAAGRLECNMASGPQDALYGVHAVQVEMIIGCRHWLDFWASGNTATHLVATTDGYCLQSARARADANF